MPTFESLIAMIPNAELLLIGDPEQPSIVESKRYAEAKGFLDRVHYLPVIRPPEDFYATIAQCHMWVATLADDTLQGRHELRMELLEVGLLGKPVVAARTPGLDEHGLADGQELIFVDPADPEGSARKIDEFIKKPNMLADLGRRLRVCVIEQFSLSDAVDRLLLAVSSRHRRT
jgi:glycosyltransferase involved in cell wall biosynthesis